MVSKATSARTSISQAGEPRSSGSPPRPLAVFWRALRRSPVGLVGFVGLLFCALLISLGPLLVPFDSAVRLDQIAAPPGSRLVLLTRAEDAARFTALESLAGRTVGFIRETGGESLLRDYLRANPDAFQTEAIRWRGGRGIPDAMQALADGRIDALVVFSESVRRYITDDPATPFASLVVSSAALGAPHILGTDMQGRDIFSHVVNGGSTLIYTALLAGLLATLIAVPLGALAALIGGAVDTALTAIANFMLTIPTFPLLMVLAALIAPSNMALLGALIGALLWPAPMRTARAQVLNLRGCDHVEAAVALDLGLPHIILREILPNIMRFVVSDFIFAVTSAMYQLVGLVFLGMAPIDSYTWSAMIYLGRARGTFFSSDSAPMVLALVLVIALFQVSMVLFARAVGAMFDPRLWTTK